jgi:hypothetical protein
MAVEYVSWKAGDPAIKADPQAIKPKTWTTLKFGDNGTTIKPNFNGQAHWSAYVNIDSDGGASDIKLRFVRDPKGAADFTGIYSFDPAHEPQSHTWFFNAKKGQPVAVQIYHNGKSNLTVTTREFKMWIP